MTYEEFRVKYEKKGIDFDNYYGFQCMDLYRQYCKEVLGVPQSPSVAGAKDVWNTYLKDYFDKYDKSPTGVPQKGDIIIWGVGIGQYGHIAIFDNGNLTSFKSFDQNWPVGSLCHLQDHNYTGVLGWLRKKVPQVPPTPPTPLKLDYGEPYGILEMQQVSAMLKAKDQALETVKNENKELREKNERLSDMADVYLNQRNQLQDKLDEVKSICYGKGWSWQKVNGIKKVIG